ncbi:hypothetical protein OFN42_44350, partial [Escherichia coli]|nr:hypothetical protein [Escherichia coli]
RKWIERHFLSSGTEWCLCSARTIHCSGSAQVAELSLLTKGMCLPLNSKVVRVNEISLTLLDIA